jgi:hypothetical protein
MRSVAWRSQFRSLDLREGRSYFPGKTVGDGGGQLATCDSRGDSFEGRSRTDITMSMNDSAVSEHDTRVRKADSV